MDRKLFMVKDERLVVPISEEQKAQLQAYADEIGVSMAQAARMIFSKFFEGDLQKKLVQKGKRSA